MRPRGSASDSAITARLRGDAGSAAASVIADRARRGPNTVRASGSGRANPKRRCSTASSSWRDGRSASTARTASSSVAAVAGVARERSSSALANGAASPPAPHAKSGRPASVTHHLPATGARAVTSSANPRTMLTASVTVSPGDSGAPDAPRRRTKASARSTHTGTTTSCPSARRTRSRAPRTCPSGSAHHPGHCASKCRAPTSTHVSPDAARTSAPGQGDSSPPDTLRSGRYAAMSRSSSRSFSSTSRWSSASVASRPRRRATVDAHRPNERWGGTEAVGAER